MRVQTEPVFFDRADELRGHFERRVGPSRKSQQERFIWDYWYIPGQYIYFRTLAIAVLPPSLLGDFTTALRQWGLDHLGTDQVTMPWLSFYVEGCRQELHSDVVQGAWSYVYSLTPWADRDFTGGETLLGSPLLLDYWSSFDPVRSTESRHLVERIPALFNQLCVFDSRLPHGVATVEGTRDPLKGRVALHGWFHDARLMVEGGLDLEAVAPVAARLEAECQEVRSRLGDFLGHSNWRVSITAAGLVTDCVLVVHNVVRRGSGSADPGALLAAEEELIRATAFPPAARPSLLRLPIVG